MLPLDIEIFTRLATQAYKEVGSVYSLQEAVDVFVYFFEAYREAMGEDHPPVRKEQIKRIIQAMPFYDKPPDDPKYSDVPPEDYPVLIDAYFRTPFRNCNYRINHFFSGNIRMLRMYEELY